MGGAVFYTTKYGSTRDYAEWIAEATNLPCFDISGTGKDPSKFDFVVIGAPVYYYKLLVKNWLRQHIDALSKMPVILFTVSGAPAGAKLDSWIANSLPAGLDDRFHHFALPGRQIRKSLNLFDRSMLTIASLFNRDRKAAKEEAQGFDYVDKTKIVPIVERIKELTVAEK